MEQREAERQDIMRQYAGFYRTAIVLLFIGIGIFLGWLFFADKDGYGMNLWTEVVGMGFTYLVLDWWRKQQEERRSLEMRIDDLVDDLGSGINDVSVYAIRKLRNYGTLLDGSLENLDLRRAKLEGADLRQARLAYVNLAEATLGKVDFAKADLQEAILRQTNLKGAILRDVILAGSDMSECQLQSAKVQRSNLFRAILYKANLEDSNFGGAYLAGADLRGANLKGVNLWDADMAAATVDSDTRFDERTVLPDGTRWSRGKNLGRFTDPHHHVNPFRPHKWRAPQHRGNIPLQL